MLTMSPPWPGTVEIAGLDAPVRITLGEHRVPSVEAGSYQDACCGLGYAVGRERLFQLDLMRRRAAGRLAELFGPSCVADDVRQRELGLRAVASAAPVTDFVRAYAAGIDRAVADGGLPAEYRLIGVEDVEPWRPEDCLLVALLLTQMLGDDGRERRMRDVMRRTLPPEVVDFLLTSADPYAVDASGNPAGPREVQVPLEQLRRMVGEARPATRGVLPADERPWGSNAVAVGGRHTADGRALLANDMHLPLSAPSLCYRATLRWADHQVSGLTVPGVPVFVAGATDTLAWGATRLPADTVDLVEVELSPQDPDRYRCGDGWREFTRTRERIDVRGADPVEIEVRRTVWGPVTGPPLDGRPLALHWAALEPGGVDLGLAALVRARDVEEAAAVARDSGGPTLNLLLADHTGATGWTVTGRYPDRSAHATAGVVRPRCGESSWDTALPPDRLPAATDPRGGLFVSANNRLPGHGTLAANHFGARRAARLGELLDRGGLRETDLLAVQGDQDAQFYRYYQDLALGVLPGDSGLREGISAWDGTARPEAVGLAALVLFRELVRESWLSCLMERCVRADPEFVYCWHAHEGPLRALLDSGLAPAPYPGREAFLRSELDVCAAVLAKLVPDTAPGQVRWGEVSPCGARHPLSAALPELADILDLPADAPGGCAESVCATRPGFGPAMRLVVSPGRLDRAVVNLPGGQSGNPADRAYRDHHDSWRAVRPLPLLDSGGSCGSTLLTPKGTT
jgi:penicillin amidase